MQASCLEAWSSKSFALDHSKITVCRSSVEASKITRENGLPVLMLLDHDLGRDDTTMKYLNWLAFTYDFGTERPPDYMVHSANPVGAANIHSFMNSWKQVYNP